MRLTNEEMYLALYKARREVERINTAKEVDPDHRMWASLALAQIALVLESLDPWVSL